MTAVAFLLAVSILLLLVMRSTYSEDAKAAVLISRELRVEGLDKLPDVGSSSDSRGDIVSAVRKANANRLVNLFDC